MKEIKLKIIIDGREAVATLNTTEAEINDNIKAMQKLAQASQQVTSENKALAQTSQSVAKGSKTMEMALGQFGWVLGDASTFLVSFRMGLMSIANNIPMVVQYFSMASQEAKSMGQSIGQTLVNALKGPGGLMLAINGVMLLMQVLPQMFKDTTEEIKDQADEIDRLTQKYKDFTVAQIRETLRKKEDELAKLKERVKKEYNLASNTLVPQHKDPEKDPEVLALKAQIEELKTVLFNTGLIANLENKIRINREKLKKLNRENYDIIVEEAESYEDAVAILNRVIAADEKFLKIEKERGKVKKSKAPEYNLDETQFAPNSQLEDIEGLFKEKLFATEEDLAKLRSRGVQDEIERQQLLLDIEYNIELEKLKNYENFTEAKAALDEQYISRKAALEEMSQQRSIQNISQSLAMAGGLFAEHTAAYKALAVAQAIFDTYKAANLMLSSAPPPFNFIMSGLAIMQGLRNVQAIATTTIPGYAKGGVIVGENGPEVIAPAQDYASGQAQLVLQTIRTVEANLKNRPGGSYALDKKLDQLNQNILKLAERPNQINLTDRASKDIAIVGLREIRRSSL